LALATAASHGKVWRVGSFFSPPLQTEPAIRNREQVSSANLRKPEYIAPSEIRAAILAVVHVNLGITPDETTREVAQLFGFKSTGGAIRNTISAEMERAAAEGLIELRNGKLYPVQTADSTG
jgi:hypothetical protein